MKIGNRINGKIVNMSMYEANNKNLRVHVVSLSELSETIKDLSDGEIQIVIGEGGYGKWDIKTTERYKDYTINRIIYEFYFEREKGIQIIHVAIDVTTDYVLISYEDLPYFSSLIYKTPNYPFLVLYSDKDGYDFERFKTEEEMMKFIIHCDEAGYDIFEILRIRSANNVNDYNIANEIIKENKYINIKNILRDLAMEDVYVSNELLKYINYKLKEVGIDE